MKRSFDLALPRLDQGRLWKSCLAILLLAGGEAWARQASDPSALAQRIQQHYDGVRDFRADFMHGYEGGLLRKKTVEYGTVAIRKPGRMRWTYTKPEEKTFVSDGVKLYSYIPADKQVYVASVPRGDQASTPTLFLAGKGNLVRDFTVGPATLKTPPSGTAAVRLTPRRPEREYEWLELVVDERTLELRMLITGDAQGGVSTLTFSRLRENVSVPDKEFVFSIPRGVDVITDAGR
jgi:outer membrane lipoprotein carrier protein